MASPYHSVPPNFVQNSGSDDNSQPHSRLSDHIFNPTPGGVYSGPTDSSEGTVKPPAKTQKHPPQITSLRKMEMKDIVLTTGHNVKAILKEVIKGSGRMTLVPCMMHFVTRICTRCVWVCLDKETVKDEQYLLFIDKIVEVKRKEAGSDQKVQDFLAPKLILLDGLTKNELPMRLKRFKYISFNTDISTSDKIIEFIEGRFNEQVHKVEEAIKESSRGPLLHVRGKMSLLTTSNQEYLRRARLALKEACEDASSYPRQLLMQLYKIVNVRVLNEPAHPANREEIHIEMRPNHVRTCIQFCQACTEGILAENIRNHIKVNGHPYMGQMEFSIQESDMMIVLDHLIPDIMKNHRHAIETCLAEQDWEGIENILKSAGYNDTKPTTIPKLKYITATAVYEMFLKNPSQTPYTFLKTVRSYCLDPLEGLRSHKGYNALHLAISNEREDFLKMLLYSNKWGLLYHDIVTPVDQSASQVSHKGYIPRRLAEALSYKSKGYDVLNEFDRLDSIWRSMRPFLKACLSGSLDYVDTLATARPDHLELKDGTESGCLFYACASGNTKLIRYLLAKHAPRNVQNLEGESPLHIAAMFGHTEILNVMAHAQFDIRGQKNRQGNTAIDYCAMNGDIEVLKLYKEKSFPIDAKALTLAAKNKQTKIVEFLIGVVKPNEGEDEDKRLALHYEVINGHCQTVKMLLEAGADPQIKDRFKKNVFHLAADFCHVEVLNCLLEHMKANHSVIQELLNSRDTYLGKDLLYVVRGKDSGRKAWHWVELRRLCVFAFKSALHSGQIDVAMYGKIITSGFGSGPDEKTQEKMKERTEDLLKKNGGKGQPDMTPLHVAVLRNCQSVVSKLLEYGADPNMIDYIGATPLHYAAMTGNVNVLALLEECGADVEMKCFDGKVPKLIADENSNILASNFIAAQPAIDKAKEFISGPLDETYQNLNPDFLEKQRSSGRNIKRYLVDVLRELTIEVHEVLFDMGSGPILEESEGATAATAEPQVYKPSF